MKKKNWTFWVDKGGTFTDIIALSPRKDVYLEKILSSSKSYYDDPISFGIKSIINKSNTNNNQIDSITIGTTVATNAILERTGEKTLLIVSKGFKDSQLVGYQNRENILVTGGLQKIWDITICRPSPCCIYWCSNFKIAC